MNGLASRYLPETVRIYRRSKIILISASSIFIVSERGYEKKTRLYIDVDQNGKTLRPPFVSVTRMKIKLFIKMSAFEEVAVVFYRFKRGNETSGRDG